MKVLIKNEYGCFEMGGGGHPSARIEQISGLGLPDKECETVTFFGQPGQTTRDTRDLSRTITIAFDYYGGQYETEKLYKILYYPCELYFTFGTRRRKIKGVCVNPSEVERIIYHRHYKIALQFICDNPYFNDFYDTEVSIFQRIDKLPNTTDDAGNWYIQLPAVATERITASVIENKGEIELYPVIQICDSANNNINIATDVYGIEIVNQTTGSFILLDYQLLPDDVVTIDLPRRKITSSISGDITNKISDDTILSDFVLICGKNFISCTNLDASREICAKVKFTNNYAMAVM